MNKTGIEHLAIIMDGNGRWAQKRGLPRPVGHKQGVEAVRRIVRSTAQKNIPFLSLFAFSSENWKRPKEEVNELMGLLRIYIRSEIAELHKNNVKLVMIGDKNGLPSDLSKMITSAENLTSENTGLCIFVALNYGGQQDIVNAAKQFAKVYSTSMTDDECLDTFKMALSTGAAPSPDLLIRTSGEQRMSNFLIWQCAYSELYFTNTLWPDFNESDLEEAIEYFQTRDRRFGSIKRKNAL